MCPRLDVFGVGEAFETRGTTANLAAADLGICNRMRGPHILLCMYLFLPVASSAESIRRRKKRIENKQPLQLQVRHGQ